MIDRLVEETHDDLYDEFLDLVGIDDLVCCQTCNSCYNDNKIVKKFILFITTELL